jgi:hypothetical protein
MRELEKCGVNRTLIDTFCKNEFQDDIVYPHIVIELLAYAFALDIGVFWSEGEVSRRCPELEFDEDGLLIGPRGKIRFGRDGVRCGKFLIPYCDEIQRYGLGLSGGFLDRLSSLIEQKTPSKVGLRVASDMVYDPSKFSLYVTKAYIRGPKGLSATLLNSPDFPENMRGTVTVHERLSRDPVLNLTFPLVRTEIMWSSKGRTKTVQIEELIPSDDWHNHDRAKISNRYLHAIWMPEKGFFDHVDGAVRSYAKDVYDTRLSNDIKSAREVPADYRKLFLINADLPLDIWCDLSMRYFYQNELVLEYLGGPKNDNQ